LYAQVDATLLRRLLGHETRPGDGEDVLRRNEGLFASLDRLDHLLHERAAWNVGERRLQDALFVAHDQEVIPGVGPEVRRTLRAHDDEARVAEGRGVL